VGNSNLYDVVVMQHGSEYDRGTGCGKTARPGLCGGDRVTGPPTALEARNRNLKEETYRKCIVALLAVYVCGFLIIGYRFAENGIYLNQQLLDNG